MSTETPTLPSAAVDAESLAEAIADARRKFGPAAPDRKEQRSKWFLRMWWSELFGDALGSLIIAWCLDRVRPAAGMAWLPQLTWWQVFLCLVVAGTIMGSLTGAARSRLWTWSDYDGPA